MTVSVQQRATNLVTTPKTEWETIAGETETVGDLYTKYILLLAAIGPVASLIRGGVGIAIVQYVMALAGTYICAVIIGWLGPRFKASGNTVDALKLVAYASTPGWLAGIAYLLPFVGGLIVFAASLYDIYLYYLGLTPVMKTPADQVVPFMLVSAILVLVVFMVLGLVLSPVIVGGLLLSR